LERLEQVVELATPDGHGRVVGAERRLADLKRSLQLHPGAGQIPKIPQHVAKIAAPGGHRRGVSAKGYLADRQRPLYLDPGTLRVPQARSTPPRDG
jgi:hypothetical protein